MRADIITIIIGLMVLGLSIYTAFTFLGSHIQNGLCENKFTAALNNYTDHGEGIDYPLWMTDCCYHVERAGSVCENYKRAIIAKELALGVLDAELIYENLCDILEKTNPATLFSCVESDQLCNTEDCVQSCDKDGICKMSAGEGYWCEDCQ